VPAATAESFVQKKTIPFETCAATESESAHSATALAIGTSSFAGAFATHSSQVSAGPAYLFPIALIRAIPAARRLKPVGHFCEFVGFVACGGKEPVILQVRVLNASNAWTMH
jgi:hypothetical protein